MQFSYSFVMPVSKMATVCDTHHRYTIPLNSPYHLHHLITHLISSQDPEGGHDLLGCVRVGRLSGHEVYEGLESNLA